MLSSYSREETKKNICLCSCSIDDLKKKSHFHNNEIIVSYLKLKLDYYILYLFSPKFS